MVCYAIVNISPSLTNILNVDQIKTQVANPDFMAVLAPQWPEPDPDPTEDQAFLQQQVRSINLLPFFDHNLVENTISFLLKLGLVKGNLTN